MKILFYCLWLLVEQVQLWKFHFNNENSLINIATTISEINKYIEKIQTILVDVLKPYKAFLNSFLDNVAGKDQTYDFSNSLEIVNTYIKYINSLFYLFVILIVILFIQKRYYSAFCDNKIINNISVYFCTEVLIKLILIIMIILSLYMYYGLFISENIPVIYTNFLVQSKGCDPSVPITIDFGFYFITGSDALKIFGITLSAIIGYYRSFVIVKPKNWNTYVKTVFIMFSAIVVRLITSIVIGISLVGDNSVINLSQLFYSYNVMTYLVFLSIIILFICMGIEFFFSKKQAKYLVLDVVISFVSIIKSLCFFIIAQSVFFLWIHILPTELIPVLMNSRQN